MATRKRCTAAQLALAWVLAQGEHIVPIPGTKRMKYLEDNLGALNVTLSPDDLAMLDKVFPPGAATGERLCARHDEPGQSLIRRRRNCMFVIPIRLHQR
jgi:diketogulonate reductase-like aldo/keto reductase